MFKITKLVLAALAAILLFNIGVVSAGDWSLKDKDYRQAYEQDRKYSKDKDNKGGNHKHDKNKRGHDKDKHKDKRRDKHASALLLQPRSLPYALTGNSGEVDVIFKVQLLGEDGANYVVLREDGDCGDKDNYRNGHDRHDYDKHGHDKDIEDFCNIYKLNDKGEDGDKVAGDNIYGATVSVDTTSLRAGDCLVYEAFSVIGELKTKSPEYSLCVSSFPTVVADSDTGPDNLITIPDTSPAVADELLIRVSEGTGDRQIRNAARAVGAEVVGSIQPRNVYQIRFPQALTLQQLTAHIETLRNNPWVESAYLNRVGSFIAIPNDPEFPNQHGLQWINAHDAWDLGATGSGVTVTVLDTGIDTHPDLPITGSDPLNHGTAVAGVIAAETDNATGVAGVAYDSELESFIISPDAGVTFAEMVAGFQAVAASGTGQIVTAGFYFTLAPPPSDFPVDDQWDVCAAINDVVLNGATPVAVVVTGAGNDNTDGWHYPARCNDNTAPANGELTNKNLLITVMNSRSCNSGCTPDTRNPDSNYGAWVDVAAPGASIRTTNNANGYSYFTGTSMSMAMVAGAAAQLRSCGVALNQIESRLENSAPVTVSYPGGSRPRIDAHAAVIEGNTAPTNINISGTSVDENVDTTGGFSVGTLSPVDANNCDLFSYNIQGGVDAAFFTIGGADMDELMLDDGVLDFEAKASYAVTVRVTDAGGSTFNKAFVINVNDLNDAPTIGDQVFAVDENEPNGTVVGTVIASDPEGDSITYAITAGNTGGAFAIDATGQLTVANSAAVDFETNPVFMLVVEVSDGVAPPASATVTVNLNDLNEAPTVGSQVFTIDENAPNGFVVGTVTAGDPDGDSLAYSITSGNTGGAFAIDATGQITVANTSEVDFETNPTFTLTVEVSDGVLTDTATVTINLNDLPDTGIPNPIIDWVLPVPFETYNDAFGDPYVRYRFEVTNRSSFPDELFIASPSLPPCGLNTSSSRTWMDIYNGATNARIYGFCALGVSESLDDVWFAIPVGGTPPPSIYITLTDRLTSTVYTSNVLAVP